MTCVDDVLAAERAWADAFQRLDVDAVEAMMAGEYTQVDSQGSLISKAKVLASLRSDTRHWDEASSDDHTVTVYGDCAVVFGRWRGAGVNGGQRFDYTARYVAVWVWRDGRWQMVADQSTEIR
jgi:ketosteroid isomerase-like protein